MKRFLLGVAMATAVSACSGGNPFVETTGGGSGSAADIPPELAGNMTSFTYDPTAQTLVVTGIDLDNTPYEAVYTRKPALDRVGYEAYTSQESSLGRHTTAYVKQVDGTRAAVTVSGPLYGHIFRGAAYGRSGAFDPPDTTQPGGIVQYAGNYVGLLNSSGSSEDLLPVAAGTSADIRPTQAAEVTGDIIIAADFADNTVDGIVYNRTWTDAALNMENLELSPTDITTDGSFTGLVKQNGNRDTVGDYGGTFGGTNSSAVAGTLAVGGHQTGLPNLLEYGIFALSQCGTAGADPVCNQPHP